MDGWWDCRQLDGLMARVLTARLDEDVVHPGMLWATLKAQLFNLQSVSRAWHVARKHYDIDNELYRNMLDPTLAYSCGYWAKASTLDDAQRDKLELICRKLGLQHGMRLLDIGCGFGSLMRHAAEYHGVHCVGLTISSNQAALGKHLCEGLPISFELIDYRDFNRDGRDKFDRIASVGMFEHVGPRNYVNYFEVVRRSLREKGLFLLHTIGRGSTSTGVDPWIEKYIFPNAVLPSMTQIAAACEPKFVVEDWHNFGADYDRTLLAWHLRFEAAWPQLQRKHDERFRRMWRYYLLTCAGSFRARTNQLWQLVLSPRGVIAGYRCPR
jgi:cyclopropane-fatty-acyl-phospholipid synthase